MHVDFEFVRYAEERLHLLSDLKKAGATPSIAIRIDEKETYRQGELGKGTDVLGLYHGNTPDNVITLHARNIYNYAAYRKLLTETVARVVLLHEIAHSVTHLGELAGKYWESFG